MIDQASDLRAFDVVIVGGGPAGISAAIWCADLGLSCCLIESSPNLGGQLHWIHAPISNYAGRSASSGSEMFEHFFRGLPDAISTIMNERVASIDCEALTVRLDSEISIRSQAIILATGVRRRRLSVPGEDDYVGSGILQSGAGSKNEVAGKRVVIVGGGDAALENALILSETAAKVTLIHRRGSFSARNEFVDAIPKISNLEVIMSSQIERIDGDDVVRSVLFRRSANVASERIDVDNVLIRIGVEPNSEIVAGGVKLDQNGYIPVDRLCSTSIAGIYAIGDVSNPIAPTIAGAVGDAATAVKAAYSLLFASKRI